MTSNKGALIERGKEAGFVFAGRAKFTALRTDTGSRITFQLNKVKATPRRPQLPQGWADAYYVLYKYNEDTTDGKGYTYIGMVFDKVRFWQANMEREHWREPEVVTKLKHGQKVFGWLLDKLMSQSLPEQVQVWHQGSCGRCGRDLTVPLSINRGIGPECIHKHEVLEQSLAGLALEYLEKRKKAVN